MTMNSDLLPIGKAAKLLGYTPGTFRRWERDGDPFPPYMRVNGQRRYDRDDLEAFRLQHLVTSN